MKIKVLMDNIENGELTGDAELLAGVLGDRVTAMHSGLELEIV